MSDEELEPFDPDSIEPASAETEPAPPELEETDEDESLEVPRAEAPQFSYNDRLYALALTRSGKSEILNVLFSGVQCQRLLLDTKPEFAIPGLEPVSSPEAIDWTVQTIHYRPEPGSDCAQFEEIFALCFSRRGPLVVCAHELAALVDFQPGRAGKWLITYCAQGGALGYGLLAGTTRPVLVPTAAIAEATHVIALPPQLAREDDMKAAAAALSPVNDQLFTRHDFARELSQLPRYGFLWKDRRQDGTPLHAFPPLPEQVRRLSIVHRTEDA